MVELDVQGAPGVTDRHRGVEATMLDPQFVQHAQRLAGEPAEFRVVPLALELADHDQRKDDVVLTEAAERAGVGQQDGGVQDEGAQYWFRRLSRDAFGGFDGRVDSGHRSLQ